MTNQAEKALFALVRNSLLNAPLPDDFSVSAGEWAEIFQLASDHDITQLLFDAVSRNHLLAESSVGYQKGKEQYKLAMMRIIKIEEMQARIMRVLEEGGIDFVLLKGSVLRPLYPQAWMRTSCDIDLLVHAADMKSAGELMADKLAFTHSETVTMHDVSFYEDGGVHLELHYQLEHSDQQQDAILSSVWKHVQRLPDLKHGYRLAPEFFAYYHLAHMKKHLIRNGGCGIRTFLDWWIIEHRLSYDRAQLAQWLSQGGMARFVEAVSHLSRYWLEGGTISTLEEELSQYVLRGGCYGTKESQSVIQFARADSKAALIFQRIFLPYRYLCLLYPWLSGRKWLYPVATIRRWLGIFDPRKRKSLSTEIKAGIQSAGGEQERVNTLMKKLDL